MESLGLNLKILIVQTINFSIVFFVLWRLAYKPIFAMLQARREKIAEAGHIRCLNSGHSVDDRARAVLAKVACFKRPQPLRQRFAGEALAKRPGEHRRKKRQHGRAKHGPF